jgi:hypothetical protein
VRSDEVSNDQVTWHAASRYPKLFPPAAAAAAAPVAPKPAQAPVQAEASPPGQSLGYYAPATTTEFASINMPRRSVIPFASVAGVMVALSLGIFLHAIFGDNSARNVSDFTFVIASTCGFLLLAVVAFVLWLMWVGGVHQDMRAITDRQYSISPGMAVGFSCIPLFDAFWIVYMPWRMASELNRPLASRGLATIPVAAVMTMQILSIPFALIVPGLTVAMYAGSMMLIQSGLNRLSTSAASTT